MVMCDASSECEIIVCPSGFLVMAWSCCCNWSDDDVDDDDDDDDHDDDVACSKKKQAPQRVTSIAYTEQRERAWDNFYQLLLEYQLEHNGDLDVPQTYETPNGKFKL